MSQGSCVDNRDEEESARDNGQSTGGESLPALNSSSFQAAVLEQLSQIQEQNELLKARIIQLEREQEDFYVETCQKLGKGFKQVDKCVTDVRAMKEVFKEVVGVLGDQRAPHWDHSNDHVTTQEANSLSESQLLPENTTNNQEQRGLQRSMELRHLDSVPWIKPEESDMWKRLNYHDFEPPASLLANAELSSINPLDISNLAAQYRLNRSLRNVTEVAQEYFAGLRGQPSLLALERRFGPSWRRKPSERTFYAKRMHIIHKIIDVKDHPRKYNLPANLSRVQAIEVIENIRVRNHTFPGKRFGALSLNQLYIYFAKKMDSINDYSLTLRPVPPLIPPSLAETDSSAAQIQQSDHSEDRAPNSGEDSESRGEGLNSEHSESDSDEP